MRLRRRLNTVLLQWFLLLVTVAAALWVLSLPGLRRHVVDERLLLARTIAHSLDTTISSAIQSLGRLAAELPESPEDAASRLRAFRFQSPFGLASYVLDDRARLVTSDPADVEPLPASSLGHHEAVTPLVRKSDARVPAVLAIVQPFKRRGRDYYLVSEMNPAGSMLNAFLKDLETDPTMQVLVVDENGVVVASDDPSQLLRTIAGAEAFSDRIRAHRPVVLEGARISFWPTESADATLTVMAPLQFAAWGVIVQQPTANAFSGLNTMSRGLVITALMLAAMGVLLARTLSRSVVSPIRQLSRQAEAMRAGDLSSAISVSGDHEIEVLARTLDEARARLASTLDRTAGVQRAPGSGGGRAHQGHRAAGRATEDPGPPHARRHRGRAAPAGARAARRDRAAADRDPAVAAQDARGFAGDAARERAAGEDAGGHPPDHSRPAPVAAR